MTLSPISGVESRHAMTRTVSTLFRVTNAGLAQSVGGRWTTRLVDTLAAIPFSRDSVRPDGRFNLPAVPVLADPWTARSVSNGSGEAQGSTPDFSLTLRGWNLAAAGNSIPDCCPNCGYPWFDCICHPQWNALGNSLSAVLNSGGPRLYPSLLRWAGETLKG